MKSMGKSLFAAAEDLDRVHTLQSLFECKCASCYVDHLDIVVAFIFDILVCSSFQKAERRGFSHL